MKNNKPIWEIERPDMNQTIKYGGHTEVSSVDNLQRCVWVGFTIMQVEAVDVLCSGFDTFTINCVRKWKCPSVYDTIDEKILAETYFYVSASM